MANKKVVSVLSTAAIGTLIATAVGSTVFAAVDGLVVKNAAGSYLNYDLDALKASVVNDALGQAGAELYKDFDAARTAGSIVSYHDNKVGFVDSAAVQKAALDAALAGTNFALDTFTESSKETVLPATVYQATVTNGKVVAGAEVKPTTSVTTGLAVQSVTATNSAAEVTTAALDGATDVAPNAVLKVSFNEALDSASVNVNNVKLVRATDNVPVATTAPTLSTDKKTISIAPLAGNVFTKNTQYKVVLKADVKNADGSKTLGADKTVATFTTANKAALVNVQNDSEAIVAYSGNIVAADVQTNDEVYLVFSENIDPTSVTTGNVKLRNITDATADYESVTLALGANTAHSGATNNILGININNALNLTAGKTYEITFTGLRTANGGDVLSGKYRFVAAGTVPAIATLTTSNSANLAGGAVIGWGKIANGTLEDGTLEYGNKFYVGFNADIDETTLDAVTLVKVSDNTVVSVNKEYDSVFRRLTITPQADLEENTAYVIKIATTLKSKAGVAYAAATTSNRFTTMDLTRPNVVSVVDSKNNLTNLPIGVPTTIAINFNEAIREYEMTPALAAPSAAVALTATDAVRIRNLTGNVAMTNAPALSMSADGKTLYVTVTPAAGEENRTFEVVLNAKDGTNAYIVDNVNGVNAQKNSLAQDYTFTFTTQGADTAAPSVEKVFFGTAYSATATGVASGAKDISAAKDMYVVFSEAMSDAAGKVSIDDTGATANTQNVELWARPVGGSYALVATGNSDNNNAAGVGFIRYTTTGGKSYLTISNLDIAPDTQYKLVITPSANAIEDVAGNDLEAAFEYEFATTGTIDWADPTTSPMGNDRTTTTQAIAGGAGSAASAFQTTADMNAAGLINGEVVALEMTDGSFYFEQFANAANTVGANGQSLAANLPAGSISVANGATVVNMTDRSSSFATLETGAYAIDDPIAIRLDAAAGAGIDVATINTTNIKLVKVSDGTEVPYELTYKTIGNATYVSINPTSSLANYTTYEVKVSGIKDMIGNTITARSAKFTTVAAAPARLAVASATPADQTTAVKVDTSAVITFNNAPTSAVAKVAVAPAAAGQIAVRVAGGAYLATTDFNVVASSSTWTVTFNSLLAPQTNYEIVVASATTNATGTLGEDYVLSFRTEDVASVTPKIASAKLLDANNNGIGDAGERILITFNTARNDADIFDVTDLVEGNGADFDTSTATLNADRKGAIITLADDANAANGALAIIKGVSTITITGTDIDANGVVFTGTVTVE